MKYHFIAIGGSAMHNLAIALKIRGHAVTGSDDEIFEPSRSRLVKHGLLPEKQGWFPEKVHPGLDGIILGMHARKDNPELIRATEHGIRIYSFPEFIYEQTKGKKRVVIGGSHGKTTITSMIIHVLQHAGVETDYLVGAQLEGFEVMVRLSDTAKIAVLEGDEYLTSALDRRPKFHVYMPDIALISGIAWDHINVFPAFENYVEQFEIFTRRISEGGCLIWFEGDTEVKRVAENAPVGLMKMPYGVHPCFVKEGTTFLKSESGNVPVRIFGEHNMANLNGARYVCRALGINDETLYKAIRIFSGASGRLELMDFSKDVSVFRDFAHAPSKLKATVKAVRDQHPGRELVACMELHTYSSLSAHFLEHYRGSMEGVDFPVVYYNPHALEIKKLPPISGEDIKNAFGESDLKVFSDSSELLGYLRSMVWKNRNLLMMSSGDFDGIDMQALGREVAGG